MVQDRKQAFRTLWLLLAINTMNFFDRQILGAVMEPIRMEWNLSDLQLGWLGTAFTLLYALVGVPLGRFSDVADRRLLMSTGLALWSCLTYVSGLCRGFWSLFWVRMGVGVGEAVCAPTASSLIGDLFRPHERGRALSFFMLGLPLGVSLSYVVSGTIAQWFGWRAAFFIAGIPGLALSAVTMLMKEPQRGSAEQTLIGRARRPGSPFRIVLTIPTMWWIIVSGALHNFNMYAIGFFLPSFLIRYHRLDLQAAGFISGIVVGGVGAAGMLAGGWLGDSVMRQRSNGRLLVATSALLLTVPAGYLALQQPRGSVIAFMAFQGAASMLMYVYYATVYATIQDIVEPALRGTAMALYFLAMYVLGASLGPIGTGWISDYFARQAAVSAGYPAPGSVMAETFRAEGLHRAMYVIPFLGMLLVGVMVAATCTVTRDMLRLREWMCKESAEQPVRGIQPSDGQGIRRAGDGDPLMPR